MRIKMRYIFIVIAVIQCTTVQQNWEAMYTVSVRLSSMHITVSVICIHQCYCPAVEAVPEFVRDLNALYLLPEGRGRNSRCPGCVLSSRMLCALLGQQAL